MVCFLNSPFYKLPRERLLSLLTGILALAGILASAGILGLAPSARAQQPDSSFRASDSARTIARPDKVPGFWRRAGISDFSFGRPTLRAELHLPALLGSEAGIFQYYFGVQGWPDSISPEGNDPNRVALSLDGLPFDDLVSGRPRYDLLPYTLISSIQLSHSAAGAPGRIHAITESYALPQPLTDFRYRSSNDGLSSIDAVHVQNRRVRFGGKDHRIQLLAGYSGATHTGEYPGSRLRSMRQLSARVRVQRPTWSLEFFELYNRRTIGAHAGVLPVPGEPYESIYLRLGAAVKDPDAERRTIRNDMFLRYRSYLLEEPLTITGFWSVQTQRFESPDDSIKVRINRFGSSLEQGWAFRGQSFTFSVSASMDRLASANPGTRPDDDTRIYSEVRVSDSTVVFGRDLILNAGFHYDDETSFPSAGVHFYYGPGKIVLSYSGIRSSWMDTRGFGSYTTPLADAPEMRRARASMDAGKTAGAFRFRATAFASSEKNKTVWLLAEESRSATAVILAGNFVRLGGYLDLAFRSYSEQGFYALLRPTYVRSYSDDESVAAVSEEDALPEFWIHGRVGIHRRLFEDDLDLNFSIRGTWSASMKGRRLDTRSGLLMLPEGFERTVPESGRIDLIVEAGVKTATIFLSFENILQGKNTGNGILISPDYPVPAQRFRFGIFWPIVN